MGKIFKNITLEVGTFYMVLALVVSHVYAWAVWKTKVEGKLDGLAGEVVRVESQCKGYEARNIEAFRNIDGNVRTLERTIFGHIGTEKNRPGS